jgi:two-component system, NarL family, response regulator LiaR
MPSEESPASAGATDDGAPRAPIRVLIADDHAIVRLGLRALIATEPGMEVVGEAVDGLDAVRKARSLRPDVIVLDLVLPRKDGIQATAEITRENAAARILVLTSFAEDDKLVPALKAGAVGYLLKDSSPQDLLQAIRDVAQGASSLHPRIAHKLIRELSRPADRPAAGALLTEREREVARLVAEGLANEEIAARLSLGERTVRTHISHILDKLHLANRTQLALYAVRSGLARPAAG